MAANMQHMAGAGQGMPQQMRAPNSAQIQHMVYQNLVQNTPQANPMSWQANVGTADRLGKTTDLITNAALAMNAVDYRRAADFGCTFEREVFMKSPTKEAYDQAMSSKVMEFFKKRQANGPNLQNSLNANAQAMMMQSQMGRGGSQGPQQGFEHMQHPMQPSHMPQGQQTPQQMNMGMGMGIGMGNQAGRGMMPGQGMGMPGAQGRPQQPFSTDMSKLTMADRQKVTELANKLMAQASEQQKAAGRAQLQSKIPPHQLAELQNNGKDPLLWYYQTQAFQALLKNNFNRLQQQQQGGPQNQNAAQAAMMQQQQSQQRQSAMNGSQDFSQFTPNMESIKDQQLNGFMAQQAGQMVVPASGGAGRNATPQPGGQNMGGQQGANNGNQQLQQQQQQPQPGQQQQGQQSQGMNIQQMRMNQAVQQGQMKQMPGQQVGMGGGMPPSQSPGMNTLNTPVSRPGGNMNNMGAQGMGAQGMVQFGDQRFNQGVQRPNSQVFNAMLASMSQDQRQTLNGLPPDKVNEYMRKLQAQRQEHAAMNGQMNQNQMQNRQQNPMGQQMNPNMGMGQMPQGMQQNGGPGLNPQQQMQGGRMPMHPQAQNMMDSMDLPQQIMNQIPGLPVEVKKWRDLKVWVQNNGSSVPQNMRNQLVGFQQKQFQFLLQKRASLQAQAGQNPAMGGGMPNTGQAQMQNPQARPMGNFPPQVLQVTPQELMQLRSQRPNLANAPEDQLRALIIEMKKQSWHQQQQIRAQQAQAHAQAQQAQNQAQAQLQHGQQGAQNNQSMQANQGQQPNRTPQQRGGNAVPQTAAMQVSTSKQSAATPEQTKNAKSSKNLKRSSADESSETAPSKPAAAPQRPLSQPNQQQQQANQQAQKPIHQLSAQQAADLSPEQRAKYEQYLKMQMANNGPQSAKMVPNPSNNDALNRLKAIGQEEQRKFASESIPDVVMTPQEYNETADKLQKIKAHMSNVGRGLGKWYFITQDDTRAKLFFRMRLRIVRQFADGEAMTKLKNAFSIQSTELDQARHVLGTMITDISNYLGRTKAGPQQQQQGGQTQGAQGTVQQQQAQQDSQQSQPAPLNAANLEKNTQALSKVGQQKSFTKNSPSVPPAPTATQPPFQFGASSPHGNPIYNSKLKNINLDNPPTRKKQKVSGQQPTQPTQTATPSPKANKNASPEVRRAPEPPKPMILCQEPDCDMSTNGFANEQALAAHTAEEHTKPKENPMKFVQENLALALGLEPDGGVKKEHKTVDGGQPMSVSTSKQGQTPANTMGTPMSQGAAMNRSGSALSKGQEGKAGAKAAAFKPGDSKQIDAGASLVLDPWAGCTIDPQALLSNLGFENGLPNIVNDANLYRSFTPNDTPESSKDSGSSEPTSDISEGAALDIDVNWQNVDTDLLLDLDNTRLEGDMIMVNSTGATLDPALLLDPPGGPAPEWDDLNVDFTKPFQLDTTFYSLAT